MSDEKPADGTKPVLSCSFCGKTQKEVRKLISGPSVLICDECIGLCNDIIEEESYVGRSEIEKLLLMLDRKLKELDRLRERIGVLVQGKPSPDDGAASDS